MTATRHMLLIAVSAPVMKDVRKFMRKAMEMKRMMEGTME